MQVVLKYLESGSEVDNIWHMWYIWIYIVYINLYSIKYIIRRWMNGWMDGVGWDGVGWDGVGWDGMDGRTDGQR